MTRRHPPVPLSSWIHEVAQSSGLRFFRPPLEPRSAVRPTACWCGVLPSSPSGGTSESSSEGGETSERTNNPEPPSSWLVAGAPRPSSLKGGQKNPTLLHRKSAIGNTLEPLGRQRLLGISNSHLMDPGSRATTETLSNDVGGWWLVSPSQRHGYELVDRGSRKDGGVPLHE